MPSRVVAHPFLAGLAVFSAILIAFGRINRAQPWGDLLFAAGIVLLLVAGVLFLRAGRT